MLIKFLGVLMLFWFQSCAQNNLFSEMTNKSTDQALLFDAQTAINYQQYDNAINILTVKLSLSAQQSIAARELLASGYAGKCGLNFLDYTNRLASTPLGSAFKIMSAPFVGVAVNPGACLSSLQTLDLIGPKTQRTVNQNAFAAVVGMVLLGSATRLYTDDAPVVGGDGTQDAAGISCGLSNAQIDNIILGYAYMAQNFDALTTSQIGNSSSTSISDSINICTAIASTACTNTDPAQITTVMRDTMKDLLNTVQYGIGIADGSNPIFIPVSCP